MPGVPSPETFWLGFDKEAEVTALQLEHQLGRRRSQRRGFGDLIARFDRQAVTLRNAIMVMERKYRQRQKAGGPEMPQELRFLRLLRRRLHAMLRVSRTIDLIRKGKPQPLYPQTLLPPLYPQSVTPVDALQVQALALDSAMALLHRVLNPSPQSPQSIEMGCYTDIPLGGTNFMAHAHAAYRVALAQKRDPKLRFIDVGCGGGMMVLLATEFFDRAEGYDYDPAYVASAKRLMDQCGAESCRVFEDNALSFESYDAYDIIYFYQPMQDTDGLETLEARIAQTARPGTILIAPYLRFLRRAEALNCGRIAGAVYVAGTSQPKADLLRREAERMGPQIAKPPKTPQPHAVEWLGRLAQACAANGYSVRI